VYLIILIFILLLPLGALLSEWLRRWSNKLDVVGSIPVTTELYIPYTSFAVRNEPEPVLRYPSIRARLSTYLNANFGHLKIKLLETKNDKRRLENSGPFLNANRLIATH